VIPLILRVCRGLARKREPFDHQAPPRRGALGEPGFVAERPAEMRGNAARRRCGLRHFDFVL
jgi:hypothetical protein